MIKKRTFVLNCLQDQSSESTDEGCAHCRPWPMLGVGLVAVSVVQGILRQAPEL